MWLFDRNFLSHHSSFPCIIRGFKLQECSTHAFGISAAADRNMIAIFYFELSNRRDQFLLVSQNSFECHCIRFVTDAFLRTWLFTDINFLEPFQGVALGLLSYLVMRTINHMIICLPFRAHLRKLIPGKKLFRIGLRKLRRDQ